MKKIEFLMHQYVAEYCSYEKAVFWVGEIGACPDKQEYLQKRFSRKGVSADEIARLQNAAGTTDGIHDDMPEVDGVIKDILEETAA